MAGKSGQMADAQVCQLLIPEGFGES